MNERHTIEELEILYPDRYIIITDLDKDEHNVISGGIVRHIGMKIVMLMLWLIIMSVVSNSL